MSRNRLLDVLDRTERELWVIGAIGYVLALLGGLTPLARSFYLQAVLGPAGPSMLTAAAFSALQIALFCTVHWYLRTINQRELEQSRLLEALAAGDEELKDFSLPANYYGNNDALRTQVFRLGLATDKYLAKLRRGRDALIWDLLRHRSSTAALVIQLLYVFTTSTSLGQDFFFPISYLVLFLGYMVSLGICGSDLTMRYLRSELLANS